MSRLLYTHTKEITYRAPEISGEKNARLKKHVVYRLNFRKGFETDKVKQFLDSIGFHVGLAEDRLEYSNLVLSSQCFIRAYLRGVFRLGSIINPDKSYHRNGLYG